MAMADALGIYGSGSSRSGTGSASQREMEHFAELADAWWDPNGEFKALHRINPFRLTYIRDQICRHFGRDVTDLTSLTGLRILDVGCGGGLLCEPMSRLGADVTGLDATSASIDIARNHAGQMGLNIDYQLGSPEDFAKQGMSFDVVLNIEVIEHVEDIDFFMAACTTLVKPGGMMIGATLNRTVKSMAMAKIGAEYFLRWVPPGTHDWRKFVKPSEFAAHFRRGGLDTVDLTGLNFDPLNGAWTLGGDLDVNYLISAARPG